jgi:YD repeat-containing protein
VSYGTTGGAAPNGSNCTPGYDSNSNLLYKTDARGVTTNYIYDALNRVTIKTYSGQGAAGTIAASTASSCYQYDTGTSSGGNGNFVGRLTHEWTQAGACPASVPSTGYKTRHSITAYDAMGRVLNEEQCHLAKCAAVPYQSTSRYDLAGNPTFYANAIQSIALSNYYDSAGRLRSVDSSLSDTSHPASLFSVGSYTPAGAVQNMTLGTVINVTKSYDNRLRVTVETATHS